MTRVRMAGVALLLALALAGCGEQDQQSQVASVGGDSTAGPSAGPSLDPDEMGVKFAQCMRDNGIAMEDPEPGQGVRLRVDGSVSQETVQKAMEACRQYNPMENGAGPSDAEQEERGRQFANCMRDNGVEAFPDPEPGQRGVRIDKAIADDPDFQAAQEECQDIMGGAR